MANKTYIVAELSANHGHKFENALASVRAAKEAGADAIKIQTYTADTMTLYCEKEDFWLNTGTIWDGISFYKLYQQAYTPWEWHKAIFDEARRVGIDCFSTPFDKTAVDFLDSIGNPIFKVASFEITDIPLIEYAASKHKPMIISTGIATIQDIEDAIAACRRAGNNDITLLKCTSEYPAPLSKANLLTIPDMKQRFGVKVGVSDHSMTNTLPITAVALGATMVEKHLILDRSMGGPDSGFSMQPNEFKAMVDSIREVEQVLGDVYYPQNTSEIAGRGGARSLYVAKDMKAGELITERNVRSVRPGYGLHPKYLNEILGKPVNRDLTKGERMKMEYVGMEDGKCNM